MLDASALSESPPSPAPSLPAPTTPVLAKPKLSMGLDELKSPNPNDPLSKLGSKKTSGTSPLRYSPKQKRRKRLVKFNKVVHNRRIAHLNDLGDEQILATWIQPEDYLEIRGRCIATVRKMMGGTLTEAELESGRHCPRGLEGKTRDGSCVRQHHKLDSIAAVMEEQTLQWNEDVVDEDTFMEVYSFFSVPCAEAAHEVALEDAKAAYTYAYEHSICTCSDADKDPAEAQHSTSSPVSPVGGVATGVVDRLKDILFLRSSKAALLHDIETSVYNETAMERRRKVYERPTGSGSALASQLRQYFSTQGTLSTSSNCTRADEHDVPSLASSSQYSDSTEREDDDDDSSSSGPVENAPKGCASGDVFTTQLRSHFSARTKRQALLKSIESGFVKDKETDIVTVAASTYSSVASIATSNVAAISNSLGTMLHDVFNTRSQHRAVVDELKTKVVK
jgi:hypothetical protein